MSLHQSYREREYFAAAECDDAIASQIDACRVSYALAKLAYAADRGTAGDCAMDDFAEDMRTDGFEPHEVATVTEYLDREMTTPAEWAAVVQAEAIRLRADKRVMA